MPILFSDFKKNPGSEVDNHDVLSTTCGLDIIDVPQFAQRPLYLAVSCPFCEIFSVYTRFF